MSTIRATTDTGKTWTEMARKGAAKHPNLAGARLLKELRKDPEFRKVDDQFDAEAKRQK